MTMLPDYAETMNEIGRAIWRAERDVMDGRMRNECFEVHIHPEHLAKIRQTVDSLSSGLLNLEGAGKLLGIKLIADEEVKPGHPVLRCTWEMTL